MGKLTRRISALIHRRRLRRELEEEMAAHREMMPADRQARFGSTLRLHEETGDQWGWTWLDQLRQDLAYGMRSLRHSPGFTLTAISVLALGIGVNLAEVQMFEAFLHRLNVRNADSLYQFWHMDQGRLRADFSFPAIDFYRRYNTALSSVITETDVQGVYYADDADSVRSVVVSGNFFSELGVLPAYGRTLDEEDDKPGSEPVAVLSWSYWQSRFGGERGTVMKTIRLNGKPVRVVGVGPPEFFGLTQQPSQVWMAASQYAYLTGDSKVPEDYGSQRTAMLGRLKPGVSPESAQARFGALAAQLRKRQPAGTGQDEWIKVHPATGDPRPLRPNEILSVVTLILLVLLVLLSACANLGNMLLARGLVREREIDIRMAVGASRWRLIRQLMTENLLLAGLASIAALFTGWIAGRILIVYIIDAPYIRTATDWGTVLACAGLGLSATFAFGLTPAFQAVRRGRKGLRARKVLVSVQVCISCVLLILSGFLTRGVQKHDRIEVTFDLSGMAMVDPAFYMHGYTAAQARQSAIDIAARLQQIPGIDAASIAIAPPIGARMIEHVSGQQLFMNAVDPSRFPMMRLPVLQGRVFEPADRDVVVVSESAARRIWPTESALGKTIAIWKRSRTVIGLVKDSGANLTDYRESVEAYLPIDAEDAAYERIVVHATRNPEQMSAVIRSAATLPGVIPQVATLQSLVDQRLHGARKMVEIIGSLGGVATGLAMIGIFGLLAFTVMQRTREIGVRMALGARSLDVLRTILAEYAMPFGIGSALGIAVAIAAARAMFSMAYGFSPFDPLSVGAGLLVFGAVALAAAIVPIRRALRVDPSTALRYE